MDSNPYSYEPEKKIMNAPSSMPSKALNLISEQSKNNILKIINQKNETGTGFFCEIIFGRTNWGAGPVMDFVNVEKGLVKNLNFSKNAPKWRKVKIGLNIFGQCNNKKCEAFKKEVIYSTDLPENGLNFNLNEEAINIKCPICKKIIRPKTCGFWECEYQFEGQKIEEGEVKSFNSEPKETFEDKFEYFDPFENGEVQWLELNIYVLPKQYIKYIKNT